jgi:hypothetical protein
MEATGQHPADIHPNSSKGVMLGEASGSGAS